MDAIADIIRTMRLACGIFLDAEFSAPWCVTSQITPEDCRPFAPVPRRVIALHFVRSGQLELQVDGAAPLTLEQGDVVALPRNDRHLLGSRLDLTPVNAHSLIQPGPDGRLARIRHGGGGAITRFVCGFLGTDRPNDPVLLMLPRVMKLNIADAASAAWIESSFNYAAREAAATTERSPELLTRLAEVLFVDAIRRYLTSLPPEHSGWCSGMLDVRVAKSLGLLHGRMGHRWTTEQLAREVGLSRSAFAERFARATGESPMRYLARQRLQAASQRLKDTRDSVARIASEAGYESESAFHRAFKREFGVPPATWRHRS